jgi:hypothetical protein
MFHLQQYLTLLIVENGSTFNTTNWRAILVSGLSKFSDEELVKELANRHEQSPNCEPSEQHRVPVLNEYEINQPIGDIPNVEVGIYFWLPDLDSGDTNEN